MIEDETKHDMAFGRRVLLRMTGDKTPQFYFIFNFFLAKVGTKSVVFSGWLWGQNPT